MFSVGGEKFDLREISDARLERLLESTENEIRRCLLKNKVPSYLQNTGERYARILREHHRRKLSLCLIQIEVLAWFKQNQRQSVVDWLNKINLDDIEPLKEPSLRNQE